LWDLQIFKDVQRMLSWQNLTIFSMTTMLDHHVRDKAKLAMKLWSQHYSYGFTNARAKNIPILDDILEQKQNNLFPYGL
jgi:hypothetical protein